MSADKPDNLTIDGGLLVYERAIYQPNALLTFTREELDRVVSEAYQRGFVAGFDKGRDELDKVPLPKAKPELEIIRVPDETFRKNPTHFMELATPQQRVYVFDSDNRTIIAMGGSLPPTHACGCDCPHCLCWKG